MAEVTSLISALVALLAVAISAWSNWQNAKQNEEMLRHNYLLLAEKQREEERQEISKKLNEFYGPCQTLLRESKMLHDAFKNGRDFRTLTQLLKGKEYTGNDCVLLDQVMSVTDRISELIIEKSGLVEDDEEELQELLSQARAHYSLLRLASEGAISGQTYRFKAFVYPRDLDQAIVRKKRSLEQRLEELRRLDEAMPKRLKQRE